MVDTARTALGIAEDAFVVLDKFVQQYVRMAASKNMKKREVMAQIAGGLGMTLFLREKAVQPPAELKQAVKESGDIVKKRMKILGLSYNDPPVVFVPGDILRQALEVFGETRTMLALYAGLWPTIFISSDADPKFLGDLLIHERLHANSYDLPERLLNEGATEYFAIKTRLYQSGRKKILPQDIVRALMAETDIDYQSEVLTILRLIGFIKDETPIVDAYFRGDYRGLEKIKEWPKIVEIARKYKTMKSNEERHAWYKETMAVLGLTPAKDKAMLGADIPDNIELSADLSTETPGGIDFNAKNLNLKEQGAAVEFPFNFDSLEGLQPEQVNGLLPVIINITPVTNFPLLLGLREDSRKEQFSQL